MTDIKPDLAITDLPDASPSDPLEALSWLGETVEEIAEGLRARGIKGKRQQSVSCPLATYLKLWWDDTGVGRYTFHAGDESYGLPAVFGQFVNRFDDCVYPNLIDNG